MNQSGLPARMAQTSHLGSRAGSDQLLEACAAQGFDTTRPKRNNFIQEDFGGGSCQSSGCRQKKLTIAPKECLILHKTAVIWSLCMAQHTTAELDKFTC